MQVTGRDSRGVVFTEETSSENLCRNGAAFVTRFEVTIGSDLDMRGRVVHVAAASGPAERLVGVQFTGPRFQRMFRSESAA